MVRIELSIHIHRRNFNNSPLFCFAVPHTVSFFSSVFSSSVFSTWTMPLTLPQPVFASCWHKKVVNNFMQIKKQQRRILLLSKREPFSREKAVLVANSLSVSLSHFLSLWMIPCGVDSLQRHHFVLHSIIHYQSNSSFPFMRYLSKHLIGSHTSGSFFFLPWRHVHYQSNGFSEMGKEKDFDKTQIIICAFVLLKHMFL